MSSCTTINILGINLSVTRFSMDENLTINIFMNNVLMNILDLLDPCKISDGSVLQDECHVSFVRNSYTCPGGGDLLTYTSNLRLVVESVERRSIRPRRYGNDRLRGIFAVWRYRLDQCTLYILQREVLTTLQVDYWILRLV